jgi:hypothetical protein
MVLAKFLRYVAVPTNRSVRFQYVSELLQSNFIPGQQLSLKTQKSRPVIHPMKFWKCFSAINAILVAIPSH